MVGITFAIGNFMKLSDYDPDSDGKVSRLDLITQKVSLSDDLIGSSDGAGAIPVGANYVKIKTLTIALGANVDAIITALRIKFSTSSANTTYGKIYKNDVELGTQRMNTTGGVVEYSEDLGTFENGDEIQIWGHAVGGADNVTNFRVYGIRVDIAVGETLTIT